MFPQIETFSKRSLAAAYFKQYFKGRNALSDAKAFTNLVITTKGQLGWCCLICGTKERRITFGKNKDTVAKPNVPFKTWYKTIPPESTFIYKNHLFLYRSYKANCDYGILPLYIVDNVKYVQKLHEDKELDFELYAIKDKSGIIINYAWAAFKEETLDAQYPIFQDEVIDYNLNSVHFEPISYGQEFIFANSCWYSCTEGGTLALGQLPMPKSSIYQASISV